MWLYLFVPKSIRLDVLNMPNAKYLAHQTPKTPFYQMFQIL